MYISPITIVIATIALVALPAYTWKLRQDIAALKKENKSLRDDIAELEGSAKEMLDYQVKLKQYQALLKYDPNIKQGKAAEVLGVTERTIRRYNERLDRKPDT